MSLILSKVGEEVTIKKITGNAETKKFQLKLRLSLPQQNF